MNTTTDFAVRLARPVVELHQTFDGWILRKPVGIDPRTDAHTTTSPRRFVFWDGVRWNPNEAKSFPAREDASDYLDENRAMLEAARS